MGKEGFLKLLSDIYEAGDAGPSDNVRSSCPKLPRFRVCLLDPSRWTKEERSHLERGCEKCRRDIERFYRELWHPDAQSLITYILGFKAGKEGEEERFVQLHLDKDTCLKCLILKKCLEKVIGRMLNAKLLIDAIRKMMEKLSIVRMLAPLTKSERFMAAGDSNILWKHELTLEGVPAAAKMIEWKNQVLLSLETSSDDFTCRKIHYVLIGESNEAGERNLVGKATFLPPDAQGVCKVLEDLGRLGGLSRRFGKYVLPVFFLENDALSRYFQDAEVEGESIGWLHSLRKWILSAHLPSKASRAGRAPAAGLESTSYAAVRCRGALRGISAPATRLFLPVTVPGSTRASRSGRSLADEPEQEILEYSEGEKIPLVIDCIIPGYITVLFENPPNTLRMADTGGRRVRREGRAQVVITAMEPPGEAVIWAFLTSRNPGIRAGETRAADKFLRFLKDSESPETPVIASCFTCRIKASKSN